MLKYGIVVLIFFLIHEAFYFLPQNKIVIPGVIRISDIGLLIIPFFLFGILSAHARYKEESNIVLSYVVLMFICIVMGTYFFPQSLYNGVLNIRGNFYWLSFFVYAALIKNIEQAEKLIKVMTFFSGIYVSILLITKIMPNIGIIYLPDKAYSGSALIRFGDYRMFFPYGSIPILFFFIALAQTIHGKLVESFLAKTMRLTFILIVSYAIVLSMTRAVVYPTLIATAFALITSTKKKVKIAGIVVCILLLSFQALSLSINTDNDSLLEKTKIGKMLLQSDKLAAEEGRMFQVKMYWEHFYRSPIVGVGNFAVKSFTNYEDGGVQESIRTYGFFNASDLGYMKILAENGLIGILWLVWWYSYFYRRSRVTLKAAKSLNNVPFAEVLVSGLQYFTVYLLVSGVTLAHFVHPRGITVLPLALALMAIARVTVDELASKANTSTIVA